MGAQKNGNAGVVTLYSEAKRVEEESSEVVEKTIQAALIRLNYSTLYLRKLRHLQSLMADSTRIYRYRHCSNARATAVH